MSASPVSHLVGADFARLGFGSVADRDVAGSRLPRRRAGFGSAAGMLGRRPADVDGGGPDVAIGMPSYDLPGKPDAGAIVVFSNVGAAGQANPKAPTARTLYTADNFIGLSSQAGARFGASVAGLGGRVRRSRRLR